MNFLQFWIGFCFVIGALFIFFYYARSLVRRDRSALRRFIPYEPRKPVPWTGQELLAFFAVWFLLINISFAFCRNSQFSLLIREIPLEPEQIQKLLKEHVITQLIVSGWNDPSVFIVVFLSGVLIVPAGEEFLFRLLLQGYAEKQESHWRRRSGFRALRSVFRGFFAVLSSSTIFAAVHLRSTTEERSFRDIFDGLVAMMLGYLGVLAILTIYLVFFRGGSFRDLGMDARKIPGDCFLGLAAAVFLLPPIYLLNHGLSLLIGDVGFALDPIPLLFFAIGTGVLYFRTHRILPGIVLHVIFNGISVVFVYGNAYTFF